jgi:hypothetical protein
MGMSALLPAVDDSTWSEFGRFEGIYNHIRPLEGPHLEQLLAQIDNEFIEMAPMLRIPNPRRSLLEHYQDVAAATA